MIGGNWGDLDLDQWYSDYFAGCKIDALKTQDFILFIRHISLFC